MRWEEAARIVAARRRTPRIEWLCSDANPDAALRDGWRARVVELAGYPPAARQAAGLASALWDWATSGFRMADDAEIDRRTAICAACPEWVPSDRRCTICGCHTRAKVLTRAAKCPLGKWELTTDGDRDDGDRTGP